MRPPPESLASESRGRHRTDCAAAGGGGACSRSVRIAQPQPRGRVETGSFEWLAVRVGHVQQPIFGDGGGRCGAVAVTVAAADMAAAAIRRKGISNKGGKRHRQQGREQASSTRAGKGIINKGGKRHHQQGREKASSTRAGKGFINKGGKSIINKGGKSITNKGGKRYQRQRHKHGTAAAARINGRNRPSATGHARTRAR